MKNIFFLLITILNLGYTNECFDVKKYFFREIEGRMYPHQNIKLDSATFSSIQLDENGQKISDIYKSLNNYDYDEFYKSTTSNGVVYPIIDNEETFIINYEIGGDSIWKDENGNFIKYKGNSASYEINIINDQLFEKKVGKETLRHSWNNDQLDFESIAMGMDNSGQIKEWSCISSENECSCESGVDIKTWKFFDGLIIYHLAIEKVFNRIIEHEQNYFYKYEDITRSLLLKQQTTTKKTFNFKGQSTDKKQYYQNVYGF